MNKLCEQIELLLKDKNSPRETVLEKVLRLVLVEFRSETGTIHFLDPEKQMLHLVAHIGLPPQMIEAVKTIPAGKGIAGEVIARGGPVTLCNLQTDAGGVARPGAKQTGVGGALCVPLRAGGRIAGTLGVGTLRQYEYTPGETRVLEAVGRLIGEHLNLQSAHGGF